MSSDNQKWTLTATRHAHAIGLAPGCLGSRIRAQDNPDVADGFFRSQTLHLLVNFDGQAVVDDPVDSGGCRQRILEDLVAIRKDEVGGDDDTAALVAFGEEGEQELDETIGRWLSGRAQFDNPHLWYMIWVCAICEAPGKSMEPRGLCRVRVRRWPVEI